MCECQAKLKREDFKGASHESGGLFEYRGKVTNNHNNNRRKKKDNLRGMIGRY